MTQVLRQLEPWQHPDLLVGTNTCDDAGVFRISDDFALVQTTDSFPPLVDDPFQFADDLGPAKVVHVTERSTGLRAVVVIDNVAAGPAIGGTRMAPDVTMSECFGLARAMELGPMGPDRLHFLFVGSGNIDDEGGCEFEPGLVIDDLVGPERRLARFELLQPGEVSRVAHEMRGLLVVGVAVDPIRREDDLRPVGAQDADDLELVLPGPFDPRVGDVEHLMGGQSHDPGRVRKLGGPDLGAAARRHLPPGQHDDSRSMTQPRQLDQRPAAAELDVVGVGPKR